VSADIVYVDDEPAPLIAAAEAVGSRGRFVEYLPDQLDRAKAAAANPNLWVFDFFNTPLDEEQAGMEQAESNGMSVFQQLRYLVGDFRPPTVLISNNLEAALGTDVNAARRHILAEQFGVEWIAPKVLPGGGTSLPELLSIADAVKSLRLQAAALREVGAADYAAELSHSILSLPRNPEWARLAVRDVATWRPPSMADTVGDHRPAVLRNTVPTEPELRATRAIVAWLIRQVLFFPSFIVSRRHVATRLGITLECLDAALAQQTELARKLNRMSYKGILKGLVDNRWWSAGIDGFAWKLPRERQARTAALTQLVSPVPLVELEFIDPVVVSNADLVETNDIAPASECVRVSDENFPRNAPPGWVRIEDVRQDRALARRVRPEDQERLVENA